MIGVVIDFETNGFFGASVLSAAGIMIAVDWDRKAIDIAGTFVRHYYPVEKWNRHAQEVNGLSASEIKNLRGGCEYPRYFKDDPGFVEFCDNADFAVAHNARFDSSFMPTQLPWICTMKLCGGRLLDAAINRGIEVRQSELHQALYDAKICLKLFEHVLVTRCDYLKKIVSDITYASQK